MSEGSGHEHIARLRWINPGDNTTGENSRAQIVDWIESS